MKQYKLEHKYIDVMVNDFALIFWRDGIKFDSILTDRKFKFINFVNFNLIDKYDV